MVLADAQDVIMADVVRVQPVQWDQEDAQVQPVLGGIQAQPVPKAR